MMGGNRKGCPYVILPARVRNVSQPNHVLGHVVHLLFAHHAGEGQGQRHIAQRFGHREVAALVAEAFGVEGLKVNGGEVRAAGDAVFGQRLHHGVAAGRGLECAPMPAVFNA